MVKNFIRRVAATPPRIRIVTVVKFVLICFAVGWVLTYFAVRPIEIWHWAVRNAHQLGTLAVDIGEWALPYIIVGAGVVVPALLIRALYRYMRGRSSPRTR
jgi:hypothetical protein